MSVSVIVEARVRGEKIEEMKSFLAKLFEETTRKFDGNRGIHAQFNLDEPGHMLIVEEWESRGHYEKYLKWATDAGVFATVLAMLAGQPSIRYFAKAA